MEGALEKAALRRLTKREGCRARQHAKDHELGRRVAVAPFNFHSGPPGRRAYFTCAQEGIEPRLGRAGNPSSVLIVDQEPNAQFQGKTNERRY